MPWQMTSFTDLHVASHGRNYLLNLTGRLSGARWRCRAYVQQDLGNW
jgi:hypothetical protein